MTENVRLEDGPYGQRAVITAAWKPELAEFLEAHQIVELELNTGKGWRGDDLTFLRRLPHLQSFQITDQRIISVRPIHFLHELRELKVQTYCKTEIEFTSFPRLERCVLEWRPKAKSVFDCTTLKHLFINRYSGQQFAPFGQLANLESLTILSAPLRALDGVEPLRGLRSLRLGALRQLASLEGVQACTRLEALNIDTCRKLTSLAPVGFLPRLQILHLSNCGNIDSLKPLDHLDSLEQVTFVESTNVLDGDLTPLLRQRHLKRVSFQNRRHYSHRREDFAEI